MRRRAMDSLLAWLLAKESPLGPLLRPARPVGRGGRRPAGAGRSPGDAGGSTGTGVAYRVGRLARKGGQQPQVGRAAVSQADIHRRPGAASRRSGRWRHHRAHPRAPVGAGPFSLPMTIALSYGGSGHEQWAWALCDAPLILYALLKFGLGEDPRVEAAVAHLAGLARIVAGPPRSRPSWATGGGRAARRILARSPTWRC